MPVPNVSDTCNRYMLGESLLQVCQCKYVTDLLASAALGNGRITENFSMPNSEVLGSTKNGFVYRLRSQSSPRTRAHGIERNSDKHMLLLKVM